MVVLYLGIGIVSSLAPLHILKKHMVQAKNVITMKMNLGEHIQCISLLIAGSSAMFFLGSYGAEGDFNNVG